MEPSVEEATEGVAGMSIDDCAHEQHGTVLLEKAELFINDCVCFVINVSEAITSADKALHHGPPGSPRSWGEIVEEITKDAFELEKTYRHFFHALVPSPSPMLPPTKSNIRLVDAVLFAGYVDLAIRTVCMEPLELVAARLAI